ncbi:MAG: hypothetical protein ACRD1F_01950, partial [Terriglobales bacterium]
ARTEGLKAAAAKLHLKVQTSKAVTRTGSVPDIGSISGFAATLFGLKPGAVAPVAAVSGKQLVYALATLQQPTDADFAQQKQAIEQQLLTQKQSNVLNAYADALITRLTKAGKITVNEATFERVLGLGSPGNSPTAPTPAAPRGLGLG